MRSCVLLLTILVGAKCATIPALNNGDDGEGRLNFFQIPGMGSGNADLTEEVSFFLYTRDTLTAPVIAKVNDILLYNGDIDITKPVKILIHGYHAGTNSFFSKTLREAYLEQSDYTIINVDWYTESHRLYPTARNDVPQVGKIVAKFIDKFCSQTGIGHEDMHVIGHSLGAHIAGVAGLNTEKKLKRVTGLDPAGPLFSVDEPERLQNTSAKFVDVIHTCGNELGLINAIGQVDFYPNHGIPPQPGCGWYTLGICSHERAIVFFAESLKYPLSFRGFKCDNWDDYSSGNCKDNPTAIMGEFASEQSKGSYWFQTNKVSPYGLGSDGYITVDTTPSKWHWPF